VCIIEGRLRKKNAKERYWGSNVGNDGIGIGGPKLRGIALGRRNRGCLEGETGGIFENAEPGMPEEKNGGATPA